MRAIAVDDQQLSLDILEFQLTSMNYFDELRCFTDPYAAIDYIKKNPVDIAFLDIVMDKIDGITLAGAIKAFIPHCHIVFITGSRDFAFDAFKVHASGYLLKPVTKESIWEQMSAIFAYQKQPEMSGNKCLRVQCFGNFEVFDMRDIPVSFKYKKTKELLAYLIHRKGAVCSNAELASILYEDREDSNSLQSQIRNLISDLSKSLQKAGAQNVLYRKHGETAIIPDELDCDYYDYIHDESSTAFYGEYMSQYSWAEVVNAYLNNKAAGREVLKHTGM